MAIAHSSATMNSLLLFQTPNILSSLIKYPSVGSYLVDLLISILSFDGFGSGCHPA